jgi:hypothetical protein
MASFSALRAWWEWFSLGLWIFSLHTPTHWNQNLLWLMPLNLIFVAGGKRWGHVGAYYAKANLLLLGTLVVLNPVLQLFIAEFYPVALTLMLRFRATLHKEPHGISRETKVAG